MCIRDSCRSPQFICPRCGDTLHTPCENPPCCPNCKGSHQASSVHCPSFLLEKEILEQCTIHKPDRREASLRAREKLSHLPLSFAAVTRPVSTAQPSHRPRAPPAPLRTSQLSRSDTVPATGLHISTLQSNCPPHSPDMIRTVAHHNSPVLTSISYGVASVEVHAAPRVVCSPISGSSPDLVASPALLLDDDSPLPPVSRKRPAPVSPGKPLNRSSPSIVDSPERVTSPSARRHYSFHYRATDFLKSSPSARPTGSPGGLPKRARRSKRHGCLLYT